MPCMPYTSTHPTDKYDTSSAHHRMHLPSSDAARCLLSLFTSNCCPMSVVPLSVLANDLARVGGLR